MKWIKSLDKTIEKWMNINSWNFELFGHQHKIKPRFMSLTRKEMETNILQVSDGDIYIDSESNTDGYLIQAMIGQEDKGFSVATAANEDIAKSPKGLIAPMNVSIDLAMKMALGGFLSFRAEDLFTKNDKYLSYVQQDPIVSVDEFNKTVEVLPSGKDLEKIIKLSKKIKNLPNVEGADFDMNSILMRRWLVNSEGTKIRTESLRASARFSVSLYDENRVLRDIHESYILDANNGWDKILNIEARLPEIVNKVKLLHTAQSIDSGEYRIIFSGSAFSTFMHEAIVAHSLSGYFVASEYANAFKNKIGKQVMPEFLSVHALPTLKNGFGSYKYDEEGIFAKDDVLVERGVLKNYLHDRCSSSKLGLPNNGHSRAQWVVSDEGIIIPEPRISNMYVESHSNLTEQELINIMLADCEKNGQDFGLYVKHASSGQVSVEDGTFFLWPTEVWAMYPSGKRALLSGALITGTPHTMLSSIKNVSNHYETNYGHCGSNSGWVSTENTTPSAYIPNVNVQNITNVRMAEKLMKD